MSIKAQAALHILLPMFAAPMSFAFLPQPDNLIAGAIFAGIGAALAFLNQSISTQ